MTPALESVFRKLYVNITEGKGPYRILGHVIYSPFNEFKAQFSTFFEKDKYCV